MAEILFVTWDGGGNVPPAVGIAEELKNRGHRVRFLGHPRQALAFSERGLEFSGLEPTWRRVLAAVATLDARVIATTGPAVDAGRLRVPANVELHSWLPHAEVMTEVSMGRKSSPEKIRAAVEELLADGPHRAAAARLGAEVRSLPGAQLGADTVEALLTNGAVAPGRPSARS